MCMHAVFFNPPLPNGNTTGIGVVVRDEDGVIVAMISGTMGHINPRANELWSFMLGFQLAFKLRRRRIELETEAAEALREWDDWRWFVDPRHTSLVPQLNRRVRLGRLVLRKRTVDASQNALARYLAEDGAATRFAPVRIYEPFGRVSELWHLDMGLGLVAGNFMVVDEEDYEAQQAQLQQQQEWMMNEAEEAEAEGGNSAGSVAGGNGGHAASRTSTSS
ncbi:hypothetical protein DCAR_0830659 [Daucus carota subsp. sativus]|uniref:Uncharacterized protein n=1 Tax=Daucus carota subsp. sativus TaxID=79200 RepID=A0A175YJK7_DAUCS|nr:hypothetical protein DCAR_0830659 [Daucus carota subsp. sativus]